jgi:hydroxyacylglutathione hydrolase
MLKIKSFAFNAMQENTYIIYNEQNECAIIDPGCFDDSEKNEMVHFIDSLNLKPIMLLNTHCHLDHVFGNKFIAEKYNLVLQLHEKEKTVLQFAPTSGLMYNLPFDNYNGNFIILKQDDEIKIGNDELTILETPGHSPGSICFYSAAQHFVIGGDVLFKRSIGRTDLPGGNHETLLQSIQQKLFVLPQQTIVYNGHGEPTTVGEEKLENPFFV